MEAYRISLAHLFDPLMAVHTSNVEPLPHQISAVYEAMLPRQPLRRAASEAPELVVSNRFGGLEAEGGGFCAELLDILAQDLPLLTTVAKRHVADWQRFTGGATVLPAQADVVAEWLAAALGGVDRDGCHGAERPEPT